MADFFFTAGALIMLLTGIALARLLWGPSPADRMMAAQLLGTGGGAIALLIGTASGVTGMIDVALLLALLAAFAAVALCAGESRQRDPE
jgi:multicomponent Na+:H+ antiporter subunit F